MVVDMIQLKQSRNGTRMTPGDCAQWIMFKIPMDLGRKLQKKIVNQPLKSEEHLIRLTTDAVIEWLRK